MKKEVYTRKPRKPFSKLKKIYQNELRTTFDPNQNEKKKFSPKELAELKNRIRRKIKREKQRDLFLTLISVVIVVVLAWLLFK